MSVIINISNYEEFLLSAVDGELNGEEMAALEVFMQQHPDVRKELELLQGLKLQPDGGMKFGNREMLYRNTEGLSVNNYGGFLLDYVDNELSMSERTELDALIRQHPHIQKDLMLLQASKLSPDLSVTFGDKASLYRNNQRTRVRPIWGWSAAAAVVVGLSIWLLPGQRAADAPQVAIKQTPSNAGNTPAVPAPAPSVADAGKPGDTIAEGVRTADPAVEKNNEAIAGNTHESYIPGKTTRNNAIAQTGAITSAEREPDANVTEGRTQQAPVIDRIPDNRLPALANIPQPATTSGEVVQQLQEKTAQQEKSLAQNVAPVPERTPVMANAEKLNIPAPEVAAAPANAELVVTVTMNGDSKLLNGVANVARFLSRKKK